MVRPSNPKLMARVLEAVTHLGEGKGSLSRDVLDFVKQNSSGPARNLTMQVRRALKHAVNAGLLRCKSGRYKMQITLNPVKRHQHHHHHEEADSYNNADPLNDMSDEPPVGGTDLSRRVQDRRKPSRRKRAARKSRRRSSTRANRRKVTKRRTATMERRVRKLKKRSRRRSNAEEAEDWPTRRRRMMSKRFDNDEVEEDDDEDEEGEEEEDARNSRKSPKMRSVNEDRYSDVSGDSASVPGRHRSRRSKHLANESRSPSRRGDGDAEGHRKSSKRSTRRRSQQRQRDGRQESAPEEAEEQRGGIDEDGPDNEGMELDEDQGDVERVGTPPERQGTE